MRGNLSLRENVGARRLYKFWLAHLALRTGNGNGGLAYSDYHRLTELWSVAYGIQREPEPEPTREVSP